MEIQSELLEAEEKFVLENSLTCRLFILPKTHISSIAVTDEQNKVRLIQEKHTEDFFKGASGLLNLRFSDIFIIVPPNEISYIPEDVHDADRISMIPLLPESQPKFTTKIERQNCYVQFSPYNDQKFWLTVLKEATLLPTSKILINFLTTLKVHYKKIVGVHRYDTKFEIVIMENNRLIFHNNFPCETPEEFNFFFLTVVNKFNINPAILQFYVWGFEIDDPYYNRLAKYTRNISFAEYNDETLGMFKKSDFSDLDLLMGAITCE